jgi:polyisoprenoid-binding protein YceI
MTLIARFQVDSFEPRQVTGDFAGWTGSARIIHDDQGAYFEINLA